VERGFHVIVALEMIRRIEVFRFVTIHDSLLAALLALGMINLLDVRGAVGVGVLVRAVR